MEDFAQYPIHDPTTLDTMAEDTSPEFVPRLVKIFTREGDGRRTTLREAIAQKDVLTLAEEAHALKSAAASFGCFRLAAIAQAVDAAHKAEAPDRVLALSPRMIDALVEAEAALALAVKKFP